jgi:hypothetical protein
MGGWPGSSNRTDGFMPTIGNVDVDLLTGNPPMSYALSSIEWELRLA